jgi:cytochrome P450
MLTILLLIVGLSRIVMKDFTFSDGMVVPAGNAIGSPILPLNNKGSTTSALSDPNVFDGFRYSRMNEGNTGPTKHQMVNTGLDYLTFGHGKHVWYDYLILY